MPPAAPLRVPVEIRHAGPPGHARLFRLARAVSIGGVELERPLPDGIAGERGDVVSVRLHLPEDPAPLLAQARVVELDVDDRGGDQRPERRGLLFVGLDELDRARVARYVDERLGIA